MKKMINRPKVSIIIPVYNCPYVDQAIQSALHQTYGNTEVIVVDDGSTKHLDKMDPYLKRIKYIRKENGGTASALNMGIRKATGEYFAWLSSDDLYDRDKIGKQLTFMRNMNADVSYGAYYLINGEGNKITERNVGVSFPTRLQFIQKMRQGCIINGCTVMMKKKIFEEIGLFNEELGSTQDYDMWLRVLQKYHFYYFNEPLVFYRVHDSMGSKTHAERQTREIRDLQRRYFIPLKQLIQRGRFL
jgi:glycosyltransferase involved in cell wall biosynthesis